MNEQLEAYEAQMARALAMDGRGLGSKIGGDVEVWDIADNYSVQHVIRPQETRAYLLRMLEVHRLRLTGSVGRHPMRTWPIND